MTTEELIALVRLRLDDEVAPHSVSGADIVAGLNDTQNEFATLTLCLFDGEAETETTAPSPWVSSPANTLWILAASFNDADLRIVTQHELEFGYFEIDGVELPGRYSAWRSQVGTPKFLVSDLGPTSVRLVPAPEVDGTVIFERFRLPTPLVEGPAVDPEIPLAYQEHLVIGACAYLYAIPDREIFDVQAARAERNQWLSKVSLAQQQLRTASRAFTRNLPPPPGAYSLMAGVNTFGAGPNDNTQSGE